MEIKNIKLDHNSKAVLTAYLHQQSEEFQTVDKRPAVLILPGGGYYMCSDREADPVAFHYLNAGYQVFILRYSVGVGTIWPQPFEDYEESMRFIRSEAENFRIYADKIAVIGFSAGGHLAACAASMGNNRPNAAILGYPVITGECVATFLKDAPDAADAVDERTCPCFLFAGCNDTTVPVSNVVKMMEALAKYEITFESHIYAYASHGFSTCGSDLGVDDAQVCSRTSHWMNESIEWLKDIFGDFGDRIMTEPRCGAKINGNYAPSYNLDCTVNFLMKNDTVKHLLAPYFTPMLEMMHVEDLPAIFSGMLLKDLLKYVQTAPKEVERIGSELNKIPIN